MISAKRRTLYCVAATLRGAGPAYDRAMFASIFIEGAATTDAVCLSLAKSLGLDSDALRDIVADDAHALDLTVITVEGPLDARLRQVLALVK